MGGRSRSWPDAGLGPANTASGANECGGAGEPRQCRVLPPPEMRRGQKDRCNLSRAIGSVWLCEMGKKTRRVFPRRSYALSRTPRSFFAEHMRCALRGPRRGVVCGVRTSFILEYREDSAPHAPRI